MPPKINKNLKVSVEIDPLERMDKTDYHVSPEKSHAPPPISQVQPQQMQTFHQNPYEPTPISQSEMPPPPPKPQIQNPHRVQQPNSNINGNMSGLAPQYTQTPQLPLQEQQEYNGPIELPPELSYY